MKKILLILLFLFVGCSRGTIDTGDQISRSEILFQHNKERMINGNLKSLSRDLLLEDRAQKWAEVMAKRDSLTHSELEINGTKFIIMGENIAMGYNDIDSVVNGWMNSQGHRKNILNPKYNKAGFGYAKMPNGSPYWCAQFAGD